MNPVYETILSRRSIRRFKQTPLDIEIIKRLVNVGRVAPSAANFQPLEFFVVSKKEICAQVFKTLGWAGYFKPKWMPAEQERPTAYIVILVKEDFKSYYKWDVGLAAENIMLAAEEENIGSCMLLSVKRDDLCKILKVPSHLFIDSVIALGYKAETSLIEEMTDSVEYWRDAKDILHVPKRRIEDIIHINAF